MIDIIISLFCTYIWVVVICSIACIALSVIPLLLGGGMVLVLKTCELIILNIAEKIYYLFDTIKSPFLRIVKYIFGVLFLVPLILILSLDKDLALLGLCFLGILLWTFVVYRNENSNLEKL